MSLRVLWRGPSTSLWRALQRRFGSERLLDRWYRRQAARPLPARDHHVFPAPLGDPGADATCLFLHAPSGLYGRLDPLAADLLRLTAAPQDRARERIPALAARHSRAALRQVLRTDAASRAVLAQRTTPPPPKDRQKSAALSAVSHASHPEAVAFLLEVLRDPRANPDGRQEAFQHLAGTGGPAGIEAVRQARPKPGPRPPWYARIDLSKLRPDEILGTKTDSKGRTWRLFTCAALGNYGDLFLVRKQGATWSRPLFTGAWTNRTFRIPAPRAFRGVPMAKLLAGDWMRLFADDAAIRRDADGDGLTDVVEARLGTDPKRADTDGDGTGDAADPCPNAAPRPLGDDEKIVAACLEARFFEEHRSVPAMLSVENVRPFEVYGYSPVVLWAVSGRDSPLSRFYGGGMQSLSFEYPGEKAPPGAGFLVFSPDGRTARTIIRRYSDGLNGDGFEVTLHKIGEEWYVVDLQIRYVS